jgi:hypothetical protein
MNETFATIESLRMLDISSKSHAIRAFAIKFVILPIKNEGLLTLLLYRRLCIKMIRAH